MKVVITFSRVKTRYTVNGCGYSFHSLCSLNWILNNTNVFLLLWLNDKEGMEQAAEASLLQKLAVGLLRPHHGYVMCMGYRFGTDKLFQVIHLNRCDSTMKWWRAFDEKLTHNAFKVYFIPIVNLKIDVGFPSPFRWDAICLPKKHACPILILRSWPHPCPVIASSLTTDVWRNQKSSWKERRHFNLHRNMESTSARATTTRRTCKESFPMSTPPCSSDYLRQR